MKEYRAHTICQCCGQPIVTPNEGVVKFDGEDDHTLAIRFATIMEVHGDNISIENVKGTAPTLAWLPHCSLTARKREVYEFIFISMATLARQKQQHGKM